MYSTSAEDEKKATSSTTTPAQKETTTVANLAVDNSHPKDDSVSEEEADFTIDDVNQDDF